MSSYGTVLVVTANLFFLPRIQAAASASRLEMQQTPTREAFDEAFARGGATFVFIDLEGDPGTWRSVLAAIGESPGHRPRVIAYGPHTEVDLMTEARELGCDETLPKGAFVNRLPSILGAG